MGTEPVGGATAFGIRPGPWIGLGSFAGAAALLLSEAAHRSAWFPADLRITRAVQAADLRALDVPLRALNALGFPPLVDVIYGGVVAALFLFGKRWEALAAAFGALGGAGLNALAKHLVERPRPSADLVHVGHRIASSSFPAGHVLNLTVFAGFLGAVVALRVRRAWPRRGLIALLLTAIALMGLARVQSGEHWPSDVLGGYLFGLAGLSATVLFYAWGRSRTANARSDRLRGGVIRVARIALAALLLPVVAGSANAATESADSLAASTGVPWNPPHAMARRTGWEQVVLLPGRILSLPLVGVGRATDGSLFHLEQHPQFARGLKPSHRYGELAIGVKTSSLGDRTGLGAAIGLREDLGRGALASSLAAEYAATLQRYNRTRFSWTGRPLSLQYGNEWRPQERFYGIGNTSSGDSVSNYSSQGEFLYAGVLWQSNRERDLARPTSALRLWGGPRSQVMHAGRERGAVSYESRFPALAAATLDERIDHLVYGASLARDARFGAPHWSRGWRALVSAERFDAPVRAFALHSASDRGARFMRYQAEAEAGASLGRSPRSLRVFARIADQQVLTHGDRMLASDLAMLGGNAGLGGFSAGRFHDLDLLLTRASYVFPLERHLEMDLHSEWGAVYPDLWSDAKLNTLHHSYGIALRVRDDLAPRGSVGLDFSRESIRFRFSLGGVE